MATLHLEQNQPTRLLDKTAKPAQIKQSADDQIKDFRLYNGHNAVEIRAINQEKAKIYLEESPENAIKKHPDLLGAFVLKAGLLNDIENWPIDSQKTIIKQFNTQVVMNIEQGHFPPSPEKKPLADSAIAVWGNST